MAALEVRVVGPDRTVFAGDASSLVAPAWDGFVGILPGHAPMIVLLGQGELTVDRPGGGSVTYHVAGGVMKVEDDRVTVLTEYAGDEPPEIAPRGTTIEREDLAPFVDSPGDPLV